MAPFFLELRATLCVHKSGRAIRKFVAWVAACRLPLRLDEYRPTRTEAAQGVVQPAGDRDELGLRLRVEIRAAKPRGSLERAILVQDYPLSD